MTQTATRLCEQCGINEVKDPRCSLCSRRCAALRGAEQRPPRKMVLRNCKESSCKKLMLVRAAYVRAGRQQFCSRQCMGVYQRKDPLYPHSNQARRKEKTAGKHLVRQRVWERDEGICGICNEPADRDCWHMDHIVPLCHGGAHDYENVQVSHPLCNLSKGPSHGKPIKKKKRRKK